MECTEKTVLKTSTANGAGANGRIKKLQKLKAALESGRLSGKDEIFTATGLIVARAALSDQKTGRVAIERKRTVLSVEVKANEATINLAKKGKSGLYGATAVLPAQEGGSRDWNPVEAVGAFIGYVKRAEVTKSLLETVEKLLKTAAGGKVGSKTELRALPGRDSGVEARF
ncbi:Uncharacterised protein [uncultured archaeon]|nr:Uncharacterised protein [uncultured archaeon]